MTQDTRQYLDEEMICSSRFDAVIEWLLIALLAFMPLAFGVVHAWSEEIVIAVTGAILTCFLLKLLVHRRQKPIWTWAYVPIALFLLVVLLQLIPLPAGLAAICSPNAAALRTGLLGDLPDAQRVLKSMPLSLYPNATIHDLRLVLSVAAIFVVVLNVFHRPDQVKRLLMAIAVIGGLVALITLAQNLFGNGKIYWLISSRNTRGYSGPFVNHNNYGQFMNLSIGAALGLLIVKLRETFAGRHITPTLTFERLAFRSARSIWLLAMIISISAATVFISLTRGGMVALLVAMASTTALFASQRSLKGYGWMMVGVALLAFVCVLYVGFDAVYERLASLRDFGRAGGGRLQILKDIAVAWTAFPMLGTGLGTHSVVYPMFDRSTNAVPAAYAENEYAQVLEETGLIGLTLLIVVGIIVAVSCFKSIRRNERPVRLAAYGLYFGISAVLIQSLADFGQHLPANAILSAVLCALVVVLARPKTQDRSLEPGAKITMFLGALALWVWMLIGANNARIAEAHWQKAFDMEKSLSARNWQGTDAEYADLIGHAAAAARRQPDDIRYRHQLGVYRWRSLCRAIDFESGKTAVSDDLMPAVHNIVDEFHKALVVCPLHGPTHSIVGQIEKFILKNDSGAERIRRGFRLAPCNPMACFVAGWLDMLEGKTQDCVVKFERAVQLDGNLFRDIADVYVNQLSRPHLAVSAAGDDIGRLNYVVGILEHMQYYDLAQEVHAKIQHLLEAKCTKPDTPGSVYAHLGSIYLGRGDNKAALECYRQALAREYDQVYWRLELARILLRMGRIQEAMREAKICLQLNPQLEAAEKFVADLSVHPAIVAHEDTSPRE